MRREDNVGGRARVTRAVRRPVPDGASALLSSVPSFSMTPS